MGVGKGKDAPEAGSRACCYAPCMPSDTGCGELLPTLGSTMSSFPSHPPDPGGKGGGRGKIS